MKKFAFLWMFGTLMFISIYLSLPTKYSSLLQSLLYLDKSAPQIKNIDSKDALTQLKEIPKKRLGKMDFYSLNHMIQYGIVQGKVDSKQEICYINQGNHHYQLERNIPVLLHNGLYEGIATSAVFLNKHCYLPQVVAKKIIEESSKPVSKQSESSKISSYDAKQVAKHLSFLRSPIPGAHVSLVDSSLPGAKRAYRNGIHEGLDWYTFGTGKVINTHTPVLSMGSGVVVRADHDYQEMSPKERGKWLTLGRQNNGQTPMYILDKLRGRTVWIQFENGVMARYCHLSRISDTLKVGGKVHTGDVLGYVGNSGTSDGVLKNSQGLHLHLDILIHGQWVWGKYTVKERRMILESVFNPS
jgi:murein DD-endopeptidase MepM/ murein hydrolase activator NlpD